MDRAEVLELVTELMSAAEGDVVRDAVLLRETFGTYDPATSSPAAASEASQSGRALRLEKRVIQSQQLMSLQIEPNDEGFLLSGFETVQMGDKLTVDGVSRTIIWVDNIVAADAAWQVLAR